MFPGEEAVYNATVPTRLASARRMTTVSCGISAPRGETNTLPQLYGKAQKVRGARATFWYYGASYRRALRGEEAASASGGFFQHNQPGLG